MSERKNVHTEHKWVSKVRSYAPTTSSAGPITHGNSSEADDE